MGGARLPPLSHRPEAADGAPDRAATGPDVPLISTRLTLADMPSEHGGGQGSGHRPCRCGGHSVSEHDRRHALPTKVAVVFAKTGTSDDGSQVGDIGRYEVQ